ncbi:MAG: hypothetical protein K2K31_02965, partial [Clostridia bacterium]|nr:hypothetical protein [Clostridia bacterium]
MKLLCKNTEFEKDLQDLVNLFYEEGDQPFSVVHNIEQNDKTLLSTIVLDYGEIKKEYSKEFNLPSTDNLLLKKSLTKRNLKNHLYEVLTLVSKKSLPWGSLTGVRPTKFARDLVERGEVKPHLISEVLVRDYHVSSDKAKLVVQILKNQKCIIKNDKLVDLFINIPICPTRCNYCSFISNELCTVKDKVDLYLDSVLKELKAVKQMIVDQSYIVRTIYIGGGTPTVLTAQQLEKLLSQISYPVTEFTVECGRA